ncbi:MAG: PTS lactose transporter subunit IIB [Micromonosporaceae bacterium]|nr:PTS lactose transporter subunit IIB [Micromonosporaceae bacterium]
MASINGSAVRKVVVACDAGMGSSVMLASQLRRQLGGAVTVEHTPVASIPADADVIVVHKGLADRARAGAPDKVIVPVQVFIGDPAVTTLVNAVKNGTDLHG